MASVSLIDAVRNYWLKGDLGALLATVECNATLRERFKTDTMGLLAERGIALPEGMKVQVYENTEETIHLVLPPFVELAEDGEAAK